MIVQVGKPVSSPCLGCTYAQSCSVARGLGGVCARAAAPRPGGRGLAGWLPFDLTTERLILLAIGGLLIYAMFFGGRAKERKRQLRSAQMKAMERYQEDVKRIRAQYPRLPL